MGQAAPELERTGGSCVVGGRALQVTRESRGVRLGPRRRTLDLSFLLPPMQSALSLRYTGKMPPSLVFEEPKR